MKMNGKTCIVTGASSGIGRETARALATMGARVVMVCRSPERGEAARSDITRETDGARIDLLIADLSSQAEVRRVAADILERYDRIDVLVNNAGALNTARSTTPEGYETTFATNHLAYFLLTHLLLDRLKHSAPSRIVNVSSRAHLGAKINFDDLNAERGYNLSTAYGQSKLANVVFTYELARRLEGSGVTANCLHPGVVRAGFGKNNPGVFGSIVDGVMRGAGILFIGAKKGAETSVYLASSPDVEDVSGEYFARSRVATSSRLSHDAEVARRLWDASETMCGLRTESVAQP